MNLIFFHSTLGLGALFGDRVQAGGQLGRFAGQQGA
jgi:hypothetical protein